MKIIYFARQNIETGNSDLVKVVSIIAQRKYLGITFSSVH